MNARQPRRFEPKPAVRQRVPLWIGLVGPSSSGKTKSAMRLADGIRSVFGGKHVVIDTESRRALHYADQHDFEHVEFNAPYGSLDYLDAVRQVVVGGASVVTIDSMSHEHENVGGLLDLQEQELQRMAGDDVKKREAVKFAAWIKPKRNRVLFLQGLLTLNCNFIFCFRAREKVKPVKNAQGKTEFVQVGYQPIGGEEFIYEMTVNALLLPKAGGVPTWDSPEIGERALIKLPQYLAHAFGKGPLDEKTGQALALWAKGSSPVVSPPVVEVVSRKVDFASPAVELAGTPAPPPETDINAEIDAALSDAALQGMKVLEEQWMSLHPKHQQRVGRDGLSSLKATAQRVEEARTAAAVQVVGRNITAVNVVSGGGALPGASPYPPGDTITVMSPEEME